VTRFTAVLVSGLLAVGCQAAAPAPETSTPPAAAPKPPIVARFDCDTLALTATYHANSVVLDLPDRSVTLPQTESASGARYSNESTTFWSKGREAMLTLGARKETCRERREPWQEAHDRGVEFRAVGQEPGWFLEIAGGRRMRLVYDYAEHVVNAVAPEPTVTETVSTYEAVSGPHPLKVRIEKRPCNDAMSGEAFPATVTVTIDTRTLRGCGRSVRTD